MDFNEEKIPFIRLSKNVMATFAFYTGELITLIYFGLITYKWCTGKLETNIYTGLAYQLLTTLFVMAAGGMTAMSLDKYLDKNEEHKKSDNNS